MTEKTAPTQPAETRGVRGRISVSEIFGPTVQGEGAVIGKPTVFVRTGGCDYRCLAPGTPITLADLTTKPIEVVEPGDAVLGYTRVGEATMGPLRLVPSVVEATREVVTEGCVKLTLDDSTELVCSPDHRWWVDELRANGEVYKPTRRRGPEGNYREAREIRPGMLLKGSGSEMLPRPETEAWHRGYLAGAMDGDGHVSAAWIAFRVTSRTFFDALLESSALVGAALEEYAEGKTPHGTPLYRSRLPEGRRSAYLEAVAPDADPEYKRGYLAGMFDAEGHVPESGAYITQNAGEVMERTEQYAANLGLGTRLWSKDGRAQRLYFDKHPVELVPYLGVRCHHKRISAASRGLRKLRRTVVAVERVAGRLLYDLQTSTRNFVAGGVVSHNCSWCDSKFAVLPEFRDTWHHMSPEEVFSEVKKLSPRPILVTLSGGNPALQPFGPLIRLGRSEGYRFTIETQGTLARDWFVDLDYLTLSPKPPSSTMKTDWEQLGRCIEAGGPGTETVMKVVVFDERDYAYAKEVGRRFPRVPIYLQVGNDDPPGPEATDKTEPDTGRLLERYEWLAEKVVTDGWNEATVLPQLHVLVWGNKRGV